MIAHSRLPTCFTSRKLGENPPSQRSVTHAVPPAGNPGLISDNSSSSSASEVLPHLPNAARSSCRASPPPQTPMCSGDEGAAPPQAGSPLRRAWRGFLSQVDFLFPALSWGCPLWAFEPFEGCSAPCLQPFPLREPCLTQSRGFCAQQGEDALGKSLMGTSRAGRGGCLCFGIAVTLNNCRKPRQAVGAGSGVHTQLPVLIHGSSCFFHVTFLLCWAKRGSSGFLLSLLEAWGWYPAADP